MTAVQELIWAGSYGSTTIDDICGKAGVKKGSFYYFFDSKADLAVEAIESEWQKHRAELDAIFSSTVPPMERLVNYCKYGYRLQSEIQAKCGCVLGCPLFSLGSEVSTQDDKLRKKVQEMLLLKQKYLESAIRDAQADALVPKGDAGAKARMLFAYYQGLLTQARIANDLSILKDGIRGTYELLGAERPEAIPA